MNSSERRLANCDRLFFSFTFLYFIGLGLAATLFGDRGLMFAVLLLIPLAVVPLVEGIVIGTVLTDSLKWRFRGWVALIFGVAMTAAYGLIGWLYWGPGGQAVSVALLDALEFLLERLPVPVAVGLGLALLLFYVLMLGFIVMVPWLALVRFINPRMLQFFRATFPGVLGAEAPENEDKRFIRVALLELLIIAGALIWLTQGAIEGPVVVIIGFVGWLVFLLRERKRGLVWR